MLKVAIARGTHALIILFYKLIQCFMSVLHELVTKACMRVDSLLITVPYGCDGAPLL